MKISPISNNRYITPKTTGYAAASGIALCVISGMSKNRTLRKTHKLLAGLSVLFTAIHVGLIEYNHYIWKTSKNYR